MGNASGIPSVGDPAAQTVKEAWQLTGANADRPVCVLRTVGPERFVFSEGAWVRQSSELAEADAGGGKAEVLSGWDATDFGAKLASMGIQCACRMGKKFHPNQDGFLVAVGDDGKGRRFTLLLVADGYGRFGRGAAEFVVLNLPRLFLEHLDRETDPEKAIEKSFASCEAMLTSRYSFESRDSGSSCTMAYIVQEAEHQDLYLGHVGNSRALKFARPEGGKEQSIPDVLTNDHTLYNIDMIRAEGVAGLFIGLPEFDEEWTLCKPKRDACGKSTLEKGAFRTQTRTLGCCDHKRTGVTADPDVKHFKCESGRGEILIMCTDGVWRVLPAKRVCDLVRHGAESLARASHDAWEKVCKGYSDDSTVLLFPLSPPRVVC